jgi:hypothetical protein
MPIEAAKAPDETRRVLISIDSSARADAIELGATIVTLIVHPEFARDPRQVALMLAAGPRIGKALEADPPPESRAAIETRMMLGAAASRFKIDDPYKRIPLIPVYLEYSFNDIVRRYMVVEKLWQQRMAAGEVFWMLAEATRLGSAYVLPPGVTRPSVEQFADCVLAKVGVSETKNFTERIWRPSWPVAHLAAAIHSLDGRARARYGRSIQPADLILNPGLLRTVLLRADELTTAIGQAPMRGKRRIQDLVVVNLALAR